MKQKYIGSSKYCNNEYWPPVESTTSISPVIKELMNENSENIIRKLQSISTVENYDENLTNALGGIYSLFSHYKDSPIYNEKTIDVPNIFRIKILLEDEMKRKIISPVLPSSEDIYRDLCIK
ncbi:hypothetical protein [bacterium endosymbiont of Bathymodiolus sp. 5 South]|jgi:hypothetical protein|uniref:hypothetical protein n=1 Tax=bacterium endosymbiont of Bathymodiolus sp. 5 South TaxID=1181670 RepID=UPI001119ECCB|nr:hypothetical protein [bacterium endosymbiont of Bathymodiolus sp. 5 South]VVH59979.1 hypothetical protein BSPCLSOX_816 [uncultured Gammaproteobacteria bacterium]VVM17961.1 hypothetical protein BSPWISOXPB_11311 [uncultured Gammaproteobacteria bacterium]